MTLTTTEELKHLASSDNANELTRRLARECLANREAQPVGYFVRHRSAWGRPSKWRLWTECSAEDYAEFCKIIATGEDDAGRFYEARILYDAPPAPAVPDGWKLVPVEPTEEMLRAAYRESGVYSAKAYRAMLAAAPEGGNDHDTRR